MGSNQPFDPTQVSVIELLGDSPPTEKQMGNFRIADNPAITDEKGSGRGLARCSLGLA